MDPAVRDLLPLHPKKPSNINQKVNPVRNSSGALNPAGIILESNPLESNPAAEQRGIISNGVNPKLSGNLPGDDLSALFDHAMELWTRSGPESTAPGRSLRGQFHLAILSCNKRGEWSLRGGGSRD